MEVVRVRFQAVYRFVWEWRKPIASFVLWYLGLGYARDEYGMGEFYLLASGFWLIYLVGFSPRQPGELSAYAHFNENGERLLGDMDPARAGRELTGRILYEGNQERQAGIHIEDSSDRSNGGHQLGRQVNPLEDDDPDLQRALLQSLREDREARRRRQ